MDITPDRPAKLLVLTHRWVYPPDKGDRIRSFGVLRELARWATCDLLSLADRPALPEHIHPVESFVRRLCVVPRGRLSMLRGALRATRSGQSITQCAFDRRCFSSVLDEWLARSDYDAVLAICSSVAAYMLDRPRPPLIVDFVDADSAKWTALASHSRGPMPAVYRREARLVRDLERRLVERADLCTAVSQTELDALGLPAGSAKALVTPNGVDAGYFAPPDEPRTTNNVTFVGQMDYRPNVDAVRWFCREVWPKYRQEQPDATFQIVGRRPTPAVRSLGGIPGVVVAGSVPDVRPYVQESICVAPLLVARGIQNKVLEALSCGAAVVASPQAVQGIQAIDGQELIVADGADSFAGALCRLARNPRLAAAIGQAGRRFVQARHAWPAVVRPLTEAMKSLISNSSRRTHVASPA